jgi:hypothetical protein
MVSQGKYKKHWFGHYHIQYYLPNNTTLLMNMDKIDTNPLLVNINKLKPYQHLELTPYGLETKIEKRRDVSVRVPQQCNRKK